MRRTSFIALLCTLAAPACSAVSDFNFTYRDGGGIDGGGDAKVDGGNVDTGVVADAGDGGAVDAGIDAPMVDGGMPCPTTCDDGNPCNGIETCDTTMGACVTGTAMTCPAADPCHADGTCDVGTGGCIPGALLTGDDGNPCNGVETCVVVSGAMTVTHSGPRCDDGIACTADTCDPATGGCTNMPRDSSCAAGEICRVTAPPMCTTTTCTGPTGCSGGAICYGGFCCSAAAGMCLHVMCMMDSDCSDGRACNGAEVCDLTTHSCASGTPITCDDGLACSVDACVDGGGGAHTCTHTPGDGDSDGYLDAHCIVGSGDDCNDSDPTVHPAATERCNGVDDNCNGMTDETFISGVTGLGRGCSAGVGACMSSGTYVCAPSQVSTVCNAMAGTPGASELCGNGIDDNCNGATDEGYAVGASCTVGVGACMTTGALVCSADLLSTVCNTGPGSPGNELCGNGVDDNCNGMIDEGFGMRGMSCVVGIGACAGTGLYDCSADRLSLVCTGMMGMPHPEVCNMIDDDCDGIIDDGPSMTWYQDRDADGYGDSTASPFVGFCPPSGVPWVLMGGDCNDANATVNPGHMEVCGNMIDDNCDGLVDNGCPPGNDTCGTALDLGAIMPGTNGTRTDRYDLAGGRDATDCAAPMTPGNDMWYRFTVPPGPGIVFYMDTFSSNYDTILAVHPDCSSPGTYVACNDDACMTNTSHVATYLAGGTSWRVSVRAYFMFPATGSLTLHWQAIPPGSGGNTLIPPGTTPYDDTRPLPAAPGDDAASCRGSVTNQGENLYYFTMCPAMTFSLVANTCNTPALASLDTTLYVHDVSGEIACNDDGGCMAPSSSTNSALSVTLTNPGVYGIYVDQLNPVAMPSVRLHVAATPGP